jgi:hypothetical protein
MRFIPETFAGFNDTPILSWSPVMAKSIGPCRMLQSLRRSNEKVKKVILESLGCSSRVGDEGHRHLM